MLDINRLIDTEILTASNFKELSNYLCFVYITEEFPCLSHEKSVANLLNKRLSNLSTKPYINTPEMTERFKKVILNALLVKEFPSLNSLSIYNYVSGSESLISLDSDPSGRTFFLDRSTTSKEKIKHEDFFSKLLSYKNTDVNELFYLYKKI